ncbi:MAG: hypothetical protein GX785_13660 [Armatimonadetes bacterium]|nr:hypothetical protein [Armatimonadota bacterium]
MPFELEPVPPQPPESEWAFVDELRVTPYHQRVTWRRREPQPGEAEFRDGVRLDLRFSDPGGLLETAFADFRRFLQLGGIREDGPYTLTVHHCAVPCREAFVVRVERDGCFLGAGDTEGIRRGLVWLEDEMLRREGPFLPLGEFTRRPVIRTRVSRCFYGPINRPPKSRDELADNVDYYPEEYLNRLAHEGVNALWFTLHFFRTVPSRIIPEYGQNAAPRLAKLRWMVEKCARYGIRIYPFCIEPAAFTSPHPEVAAAAAAHPDLRGHRGAFCTSTEKGQAYLEEATRTLFSEVPGLGGLIVIPVGERLTHCYSSSIPDGGRWPTPNTCPRCSQRKPWDVLSDTLAGLARGMHSVDPDAELIAWPYGQFISWGPEATVEAARHIPKGVILQHNFETGGFNRQLGKMWPAWDYWLSYAGPSELFERCARAAVESGARVSAKLQVGCSHETATAQVVPAPGLLHRKYQAMRRLGVSAAMHSWYFGTYPSLMTRAAGELSFDPCPEDEDEFLLTLARRDWGRHAPEVARAWRWFCDGYSQYPTAHIFGYYGPMHDGPAWPLYLIPRRLPLAPTWQIGYPPSGDYIAECVTNRFTLREILTLCRRMAERWERGVRILKKLRPHFADNPECLADIGVATALGLQFRSGYNILRFYALREELAVAAAPETRLDLLSRMREIVLDEMAIDDELIPLAEADSRLGFHSEAEGYKYTPEMLRWRKRQLQRLLDEEFPEVEARVHEPEPLFPEYTGERPAGAWLSCPRVEHAPAMDGLPFGGVWDELPTAECNHWLRQVYNVERWKRCAYDPHDHVPVAEEDHRGRATTWKACRDARWLYLGVCCEAGDLGDFSGNAVQVMVERFRTEPRRIFTVNSDGSARYTEDDGYIPREAPAFRVVSRIEGGRWSFVLRLPLSWLGRGGAKGLAPLRINVERALPVPGKEGAASASWAKKVPARGRLVWGYLNPATDFGWLLFDR